ncbi:hypothetical protein PHYPSEUDO_013011 [Phytophthora pseudosyringae]|uniref:Uncharacterized protein n=1 Tax=Phytophthora pseudosyringae TaxID=221518 RepID=A0A8T1V5U4_9STRA|nr:hypothetical protein PHYPSEUDO_013011 [Phytophthora pseudosyringae]
MIHAADHSGAQQQASFEAGVSLALPRRWRRSGWSLSGGLENLEMSLDWRRVVPSTACARAFCRTNSACAIIAIAAAACEQAGSSRRDEQRIEARSLVCECLIGAAFSVIIRTPSGYAFNVD